MTDYFPPNASGPHLNWKQNYILDMIREKMSNSDTQLLLEDEKVKERINNEMNRMIIIPGYSNNLESVTDKQQKMFKKMVEGSFTKWLKQPEIIVPVEKPKTPQEQWNDTLKENIGWSNNPSRTTNFCFLNDMPYDVNKQYTDTCVPVNSDGVSCDNFKPQECFVERLKDIDVYHSINWNKLKKNDEQIFADFCKKLYLFCKVNTEFKRSFNIIYNLFNVDSDIETIDFEFIPERLGNINNANICGDIMFSFKTLCRNQGRIISKSGI